MKGDAVLTGEESEALSLFRRLATADQRALITRLRLAAEAPHLQPQRALEALEARLATDLQADA